MTSIEQAPHGGTPTIGIDVGGTFTDFVLHLPDGRMLFHKQPSTPRDPSEAVQKGLQLLFEREPALRGAPMRLVHGATIALNAVLQRKVARIALVVSTGTRDVLEIARIRLPKPFDIRSDKELSIVPRELVFEAGARIAADGRVLSRPDDAELDALCKLLGKTGIGAVAVMLLNSYIAPDPEAELAARIRERLPGILVTQSAEIWPEVREYERAVVSCLNAQIHPLMQHYLDGLDRRVRGCGGAAATIQLTSSAGGMLSIRSARDRPIDTMLSGPASGATAAARVCQASGITSAISFDMGGTSADIAMIRSGEVEFTTKARVGDLPLMMPVVGVSSIGAGGGSIVSVDNYGVIKVGPESAGADPGPVAYGLGATRPTVTDCYLVMGFIDPDRFLGGKVKLDRGRSIAALSDIAARLGLQSAEQAAEAALRVATTRMATELFKQLAQRGDEPAKFTLLPFGGAGPTHAVMLAIEAQLASVAVPPAAATFCALGAAMADVRREFVRGLGHGRVQALGDRLWENWSALEAEADLWLDGEKVQILSRRRVHALDMRYSGQSFSITTFVPLEVRDSRSLAGLIEAFHRAHESIYGFHEADHAVEAVTQRLSIIGEVPKLSLPRLEPGNPNPRPRWQRRIFLQGAWIESAIYRREDFGAQSAATGPAVIEQDDTSLWVPPGWAVRANEHDILVVDKERNDAT